MIHTFMLGMQESGSDHRGVGQPRGDWTPVRRQKFIRLNELLEGYA